MSRTDKEELRIGVYVCHCGTNIAGKVDVAAVTQMASKLPGVVVAREYKFMCSDPGQDLIVKDIKEHKLNRVVVASCSPRMHEPTFRRATHRGGLNPFLMAMANIREHCSWVTQDHKAATEKAMDLVRGAVARAAWLEPLEPRQVPVNADTLVIGGGIAGIQAALEIANAGNKVYLVEKEPSIGGHMAQFDKTFPTLDCSACILTPKMVSVGQHKNIKLLSYSEVEDISGYVGNFHVKVRRKSRRVDENKCNGCGVCWAKCPAVAFPRKRQVLLGGKPIRPDNVPAPEKITDSSHKPDAGKIMDRILAQFDKLKAEKPAGTCSMCALCVRVCRDVVGAGVLGIGKAGNDKAIVVEKPERCISCGACAQVCHSGHISIIEDAGSNSNRPPRREPPKVQHRNLNLGPNRAIAIPFMQAVPALPVIDRESCIYFKTGGCQVCKQVCERQAIDHAMEDQTVEFDVGSIIAATGFTPFDASRIEQFGYGRLPNVLTALEFEKLNNASGPTGGKILMANGEPPKSVALIHCVGSRDKNFNEYCSRVCCMMALKYAHLIHEKTGAEVYDFYIDMRCFGKGYEEFYNRLLEEGVFFVRGRVGEISDYAIYEEEKGKLVVRCEDTLIGAVRRIPVDMVVLMTGLEARKDADVVAHLVGCARGKDGFFLEQHPKLAPVATATDGVFIAGVCQGPKDIPDTVAQASAAAAAAISLSKQGKVEVEPITARVNEDLCSGCRLCNTLCPFNAISFDEKKKVSAVNDAMCKGCGTCAAACPGGAIQQQHFKDRQLLEEIQQVCAP